MIDFLITLKSRNEALFYFGLICFTVAAFTLIEARFNPVQINGTNGWYKPFKFALSIGVFCWSMGWYTGYLHLHSQVNLYSWTIIVLLGYELFYVTFQAARGQLSHYNVSSPVYSSLTLAMALAAIAATLYTGYVGILFFIGDFPELPLYYLWAIRISIMLFVVFAFEGALMGANGSHTVGAEVDDGGIPLLNWSRKYGDLRIAHFVGMHSLPVLPLMAYYLLRDIKLVLILGFVYGGLALLFLLQALQGRPLLK